MVVLDRVLNKGLLPNGGSGATTTMRWVTSLETSTGCELSPHPWLGYDASSLRHAMQPIEQSSGGNEWIGSCSVGLCENYSTSVHILLRKLVL